MKGSQLTLYATNQRHRRLHKTVVDWVLDEIAKVGIHGATVTEVSESIDAHGKYHAARFFDIAEQPVAVMVIAVDDQIDALLANLKAGGVRLLYTRGPIEFEVLGEPQRRPQCSVGFAPLSETVMNGFQLTFYTEQNKRHGHRTVCEWLLHEVKELGIHGATVISGSEGIGHAGARHAAHMLKLADQPVQIIVAATEEEAQRLLDIVRAERVHLFYTRSPIEFGLMGEDDPQHHPKKVSLFHKRAQR